MDLNASPEPEEYFVPEEKVQYNEHLDHRESGAQIRRRGWDDPYVPRTHEGLLQWKYSSMNSVDFLFEVVDNRQLLYLFERGKKKLMDYRVIFPDSFDESTYSGKIIECSWNSEENAWVFMRERVHKGTPKGRL